MDSIILTFMIYAVLVGLLALAISAAFRSFYPKKATDSAITPFIDFPPPDPLMVTSGVRSVGTFAMLWAIVNALACVFWLLTNHVIPMTAETFMVAIYLLVASLYFCVGGLLLTAGVAQGRRMIAWGGFLYITIMILGLGFTLLMAAGPSVTEANRFAGQIGAVVVLLHLVIDAILGRKSQTVGLVADPTNANKYSPAPPSTSGDGAM